MRRLTIKDAVLEANNRGGACLSTEYTNNMTCLSFKCSEGHLFDMRLADVRSGHWCPICGQRKSILRRTLSLQDVIGLVEKRGGKCISREYINSKTKMVFMCKVGHLFYTERLKQSGIILPLPPPKV